MLDTDGPAAPPRANGELVFEFPWESRVFGLTMALRDAGHFEWDEFRAHLIDEISRWPDGREYHYWACWLAAFERLLAEKGLCASDVLDARANAYAARPHGHDH